MKRILIMLSTYNGHKYLREQLDSLYKQKNVDIHILVRDDGSVDDTLDILSEYQNKFGKMTICADSNIGAAKSFHKLMAYANDKFSNFDYYSFCDQDDVWMENKLYAASQELEGKYNALYYCNALTTNSKLEITGEHGVKKEICLQYVMFRQPALGCTQVMTNSFFRTCADISRKYVERNPSYIILHDKFTIWISQMIETEVVVDDTAYMLYRQHGDNVASHTDENIKNKIQRVHKRISQQRGSLSESLLIISELLGNRLTNNAVDVFCRMSNYQDSISKTIAFACYMQQYYSNWGIKLLALYSIVRRLY